MGVKTFAQSQKAVRAYIKGGFFDLAEACCNDPELDTGAQGALLNEVAAACSKNQEHVRAVALFQTSLTKLRHPATLRNLCEALAISGRGDEAIPILQNHLRDNPEDRATQEKYLRLTQTLGRLDLSEPALRQMLEQTPNDASLLGELAYVLDRTERESMASTIWTHLLDRDQHNAFTHVRHALSLPAIMRSQGSVKVSREKQRQHLEVLTTTLEHSIQPTEKIAQALNTSNFYSAYHGEDDLVIQKLYARTITHFLAQSQVGHEKPLQTRTKPRVAFVSALWHNHTVGRYFSSWVAQLDRSRFEVQVFHNGKTQDEITAQLAQISDYRYFDNESKLYAEISAAAPDILIYPDIGMTARNLPLLANRLAPIQCAAWGHPVTTGFATIDAYFSCEDMEPQEGQTHYVEPLKLLPGIGTCFTPPPIPPSITREILGLPLDKTLLLCPQSPHKIHPDNHAPWAEILRRSPNAHWVMFSSKHGHHTAELIEVLKAFDPILTERLIVLPQTSHERFLQVNLACDLMLDTLRWSGGNTSLDAIQCNLPIVSLPGRFMRGRQTLGMYKLMGLEDEISTSVEQYVEKAVYLAKTPTAREQLSAQIAANKHKLFNDLTPIRALERHLFELLAQKGLKFESAAHPDAATLQA